MARGLLTTAAAYYLLYVPAYVAEHLLRADHMAFGFFVHCFVAAVGAGTLGALVPRLARPALLLAGLVATFGLAPATGKWTFAVLLVVVGLCTGAASAASTARQVAAGVPLAGLAAAFVPGDIRTAGIVAMLMAMAGRPSADSHLDPLAGLGSSIVLFPFFSLVALLPLYLINVEAFSAHRADHLAGWVWAAALVAALVRSRLLGAAAVLAGTGLLAWYPTSFRTGDGHWYLVMVLMAAGSTALAGSLPDGRLAARYWVAASRVVLCAGLALLPVVVSSESTLVGSAGRVASLAKTYDQEIRTARALDPSTLLRLATHPSIQVFGQAVSDVESKLHVSGTDAASRILALSRIKGSDLLYLVRNFSRVTTAATEIPRQWRHWWELCFWAEAVVVVGAEVRAPARS